MPLFSNLSATRTFIRVTADGCDHKVTKSRRSRRLFGKPKHFVIFVIFVTCDRQPWLVSYRVNQQAVSQLGLEPGGLGRHDAPFVRDRHQVVDRDGVHRERDRGLAARSPPSRARRCRARRRRSRSACRSARRRSSSSGPSTWCCSSATSSALAREPSSGAAADRSSAYHLPSRNIATSPLPRRRRGARRGPARRARSASRNCAGVCPARSLTVRL